MSFLKVFFPNIGWLICSYTQKALYLVFSNFLYIAVYNFLSCLSRSFWISIFII
nr:MAG TPA: hypothetical protein [Caudoviricetes sp.]